VSGDVGDEDCGVEGLTPMVAATAAALLSRGDDGDSDEVGARSIVRPLLLVLLVLLLVMVVMAPPPPLAPLRSRFSTLAEVHAEGEEGDSEEGVDDRIEDEDEDKDSNEDDEDASMDALTLGVDVVRSTAAEGEAEEEDELEAEASIGEGDTVEACPPGRAGIGLPGGGAGGLLLLPSPMLCTTRRGLGPAGLLLLLLDVGGGALGDLLVPEPTMALVRARRAWLRVGWAAPCEPLWDIGWVGGGHSSPSLLPLSFFALFLLCCVTWMDAELHQPTRDKELLRIP